MDSSIFFYINSSKHRDNQSILLYGRRVTDGMKINFLVNDFFPHFAARITNENIATIKNLESKKIIIKKEFFLNGNEHEPYKNPDGARYVMLYLPSTKEITCRTLLAETSEDDIIYERRFRIDKNIYCFFYIDDMDMVLKQKPIQIEFNRGKKRLRSSGYFYTINCGQVYGF